MRLKSVALLGVLAGSVLAVRSADASPTLNYQGRITARGSNFTGQGYFKFLLINGQNEGVWSSDGSPGADEPANSVGIEVNNGLFNVELGDPAAGMSAISPVVFHERDLLLRTWFSTNSADFEQLAPDVRIRAPDLAHFNTGNLLVVDDDGIADFDNIQDAIDAVSSGRGYSDGILVMPGRYETDVPLRFPTNGTIRLRGAGAHQSNVTIVNNSGVAMEMNPGSDVFLENLSVFGLPAVRCAGSSERWWGFNAWKCSIQGLAGPEPQPAVGFAGDHVVIRMRECDVRNGADAGAIAISGEAQLYARSCDFSAAGASTVSLRNNARCDLSDCELAGARSLLIENNQSGGNTFSECRFNNGITITNGTFGATFTDCNMGQQFGVFSANGWLMISECRMDGVRIVGGAPHMRFHDCYLHPLSNTTFCVEDATGYMKVESSELHTSDASAIEIVASAGLPNEYASPSLHVENCQVNGDVILRNNRGEWGGPTVTLRNSDVVGDQDGIRCDGPYCYVSLVSSEVSGYGGSGIMAHDDMVHAHSSVIYGYGGSGLHVSGSGWVDLIDCELWGQLAGAFLELPQDPNSTATIANSMLWGTDGAGIECRGGIVDVNHSRLSSWTNTMAKLTGSNGVYRFNQCVFTSGGEVWGEGGTNAAVTLYGAAGETPSPALISCSLEPSSQATYAIGLDGGATTGNVMMVNCVLTTEIDPRIGKVAPKSQDSFGNVVMPRKH